ncbi:MAG: hypothetical protein ACYDIC_04970 [Desulfobaccales bacterium]
MVKAIVLAMLVTILAGCATLGGDVGSPSAPREQKSFNNPQTQSEQNQRLWDMERGG